MSNRFTKTTRVEHHILNLIARDNIEKGGRLMPERELAETLGVGLITVQRAMGELVRRDVVERVQGKGTFVKRDPTGGRCLGTVAFLLVKSPTPLYDRLVDEAREAAERRRHDLKFIHTGERPNDIVIGQLSSVSGAIISGVVDDGWMEFLRTMHIPTAVIGLYTLKQPALCIHMDLMEGTRVLVERLRARGCRRIGLLNGARTYPLAGELYRGYKSGLQEAGLPGDENWTCWCRRDRRMEDFAEFFGRNPAGFDGLIIEQGCFEPFLLYQYQNDLPKVKPILGMFSPAPLEAPGITRVEAVEFEESLGEQAVNLLFDAIAGQGTPRKVLIPPKR